MKKFLRFFSHLWKTESFALMFLGPLTLFLCFYLGRSDYLLYSSLGDTFEYIVSLGFSSNHALVVFASASAFAFNSICIAFYTLISFFLWASDQLKKKRCGPDTVRDNFIVVCIDDVTYQRLESIIEDYDVKMADFCRFVLESVDPVLLADHSDPEV